MFKLYFCCKTTETKTTLLSHKQVVHGDCGLEDTAVHTVCQTIGGDECHMHILALANMH